MAAQKRTAKTKQTFLISSSIKNLICPSLPKKAKVCKESASNLRFITTNHTNGHERLRVSKKARTDKMKRLEGRKKIRISSFS
jgi:hypothetical protein